MEVNNINSCLLWGVGLYTPVDLGSVFNEDDLYDTGLELDSHITVLYSSNKILPKNTILEDIKLILGDEKYEEFISYCKNERFREVSDLLELSSFSNDSDYVILKLKKNNEIYGILNLINKGLRTKYRVESSFAEYTPHITLAELRKGEAQKYLANPELNHIIEDSRVDFEDLIYSSDNGDKIWKQKFLTQFKNVDRYFRIENLRASNDELLSNGPLL